jgi:hypothetical protein
MKITKDAIIVGTIIGLMCAALTFVIITVFCAEYVAPKIGDVVIVTPENPFEDGIVRREVLDVKNGYVLYTATSKSGATGQGNMPVRMWNRLK